MGNVMMIGSSPQGRLYERRARLRRALSESGADGRELLQELAEIDAAIAAESDRRRLSELEDLVSVGDAMRQLRECSSPDALIEAAPQALADTGDFTRTMISRVRGSFWDPVKLVIQDGIDPQEAPFQTYIQETRIPLEHMLLETDLVRRRIPGLIRDTVSDARTFERLIEVSRCTSYVVAPIMPTKRVIGFFHADRYNQRECDEHDRELVWAFAEHFGLLFERAVLVERLEDQNAKLHGALADATTAIAALNEAEIELVRRGPLADPPTLSRSHGAASRIDQLLTQREREVMEFLVAGATNREIAASLVISSGTVKSHLKRILRKLHVTSRAEAVAKYLHIVRLDERTGR